MHPLGWISIALNFLMAGASAGQVPGDLKGYQAWELREFLPGVYSCGDACMGVEAPCSCGPIAITIFSDGTVEGLPARIYQIRLTRNSASGAKTFNTYFFHSYGTSDEGIDHPHQCKTHTKTAGDFRYVECHSPARARAWSSHPQHLPEGRKSFTEIMRSLGYSGAVPTGP